MCTGNYNNMLGACAQVIHNNMLGDTACAQVIHNNMLGTLHVHR